MITKERQTGLSLMAPDQAGGLIITTAGHVINLVRGERSPEVGRAFVRLLRDQPAVLEETMALVYQRPDLLNAPTQETPTLAELRTGYSTIITALTNDKLALLLETFDSAHPGYPLIKPRIEAKRDQLVSAGIGEPITDMEFLLGILIEDGNARLLNSDDYRLTIASHGVYGQLWDYLDDNKIRLSFQEDKNLTHIGQRLLFKKRDYEFISQGFTPKSEDEAFVHELAQLQLVAMATELQQAGGIGVAEIKAEFQKSFAIVLARWPTKARELREKFGNLMATTDWEHWAPPPPGALTDRDELRDILGTA